MAHCVVRTDLMEATHDGNLIKSVYFYDGSNKADVDNGMIVEVGGLVDGEREIHKATAPTAASTYVGIVCTPEEADCPLEKGHDKFYNKAGEPARVMILTKGSIYSVTAEAFSAVPTVGKLVEVQAGLKHKVVTSATSGSTQIGKVIDIEAVGKHTFYVVEVQ